MKYFVISISWTICYYHSWLCSFWLSPLVSDTPSSSVRAFCLTLHNAAIQSLRIFFSATAFFPFAPWTQGCVSIGQAEFQWAPNVDTGNPTCLPSPFGFEQSGGLVFVILLQQLSWRNAAWLVGSCLVASSGVCMGCV